jgi:hypothetical protein
MHLAQLELARAAAGSGCGDELFDTMPLSVGEVAWVELVAHARECTLPAETF